MGRNCFTIDGREHEGRVFYETGISRAFETFQEAQASADPQAILIVEYTFL
jgi:hypothetical protein